MSKTRGRRTKYKEEYCQQLLAHMRKGYSFESFAAVIDCHRDSLYEWTKKHPNFSDAHKKGFELCRLYWEKLFMGAATGAMRNTSAAMIIFKMKCTFGYKDGSEANGIQTDRRDDSNKVWVTRWRDKLKV